MTTAEVLSAIEAEWGRLVAAVEALGDRATTVTVTGEGWTAKDVLGHLLHWARQVTFGLGAPFQPPAYMVEERSRREATGEDTSRMPTGDESNALAVAHYKNMSLHEVRGELARLVEDIVARTKDRTDGQMNATDQVPFAPGRPLWQFIGGETFLHWPVHAAELERIAAG